MHGWFAGIFTPTNTCSSMHRPRADLRSAFQVGEQPDLQETMELQQTTVVWALLVKLQPEKRSRDFDHQSPKCLGPRLHPLER